MLLNQSQQEFCAALKAARERRGLKLTDIAAATKVCPSYFSALERNDLRVWPKGLFRRSFFRGYASTVGLPVEETLAEFIRLFPEDEKAAGPLPEVSAQPARLVLDQSWHGPKAPIRSRFAIAAADLLAIALAGVVAAWFVGMPLPAALALVSIGYFTVGTLLLGQSAAAFCVQRRHRIMDALRPMLPKQSGSQDAAPEATADERRWFSDARRVRPRGQAPGLRVRFKVSS